MELVGTALHVSYHYYDIVPQPGYRREEIVKVLIWPNGILDLTSA